MRQLEWGAGVNKRPKRLNRPKTEKPVLPDPLKFESPKPAKSPKFQQRDLPKPPTCQKSVLPNPLKFEEPALQQALKREKPGPLMSKAHYQRRPPTRPLPSLHSSSRGLMMFCVI